MLSELRTTSVVDLFIVDFLRVLFSFSLL